MERKLGNAIAIPSLAKGPVGYPSINKGSKIHSSRDKDTKDTKDTQDLKDTCVETLFEKALQSSTKQAIVVPTKSVEPPPKKNFQHSSSSVAQPPKKNFQHSSSSDAQPKESVFPSRPSWLQSKQWTHTSPDLIVIAVDEKFESKLGRLAKRALGPEWQTFFNYAVVTELLSSLVCEFSQPTFQRELQRLLIRSRKISMRASDILGGKRQVLPHALANQKVVPGRCELCRSIEEKVMARMNVAKTSSTSIWKAIAPFAYDEKITASLCIVEELLALLPGSTLTVLLDPEEHSRVMY